jgi:hypothetical protein
VLRLTRNTFPLCPYGAMYISFLSNDFIFNFILPSSVDRKGERRILAI